MSKSLETLAAEYEAAQDEYVGRRERQASASARSAAAESIADITSSVADAAATRSLVDKAEARMNAAHAALSEAQAVADLADIRERAASDPGQITMKEMDVLTHVDHADRAADPEAALDRRGVGGYEDVRLALAKQAEMPFWLQAIVDGHESRA